MGTAILTSRSGAAGGSSGGFEVGDVLTTTRTDLGDDWFLCNGGNFYPSNYPELAKLFPILIGNKSTVSFKDISNATVLDSFIGYDNRAYRFYRSSTYTTDGLFYLVYTSDFKNYTTITLNMLNAGYLSGELSYIQSCTVSEQYISIICIGALIGSSATNRVSGSDDYSPTISYIKWDATSKTSGSWTHVHPKDVPCARVCPKRFGWIRYAGNGNHFIIANYDEYDSSSISTVGYTLYGIYKNNFSSFSGVVSSNTANIYYPRIIDSDTFIFTEQLTGYYNFNILMCSGTTCKQIGSGRYDYGYGKYFEFDNTIYLVVPDSSVEGRSIKYSIDNGVNWNTITSNSSTAIYSNSFFNFNNEPYYTSSDGIYKLIKGLTEPAGSFINKNSNTTAFCSLTEAISINGIIIICYGNKSTDLKLECIDQSSVPIITTDNAYNYIKAK